MSDLTNSDFVEGIDKLQDLHAAINTMVGKYGAGDPVAIVWSKNDSALVRKMHGIVVSQCQYGQRAYSFSVDYDNDRFTLHMLQRQMTVKSTYFAP